MFEHKLNNIVLTRLSVNPHCCIYEIPHPKLVLHKIDGVLVELIKKWTCLLFRKMFETPLEYPTTIWVCGKIVYVATE